VSLAKVDTRHVWATSALFYAVRAIVDMTALDWGNAAVEMARAGLCKTGAMLALPTYYLDRLTIAWARNDAHARRP
jgi:Mg2+/citrate symporter